MFSEACEKFFVYSLSMDIISDTPVLYFTNRSGFFVDSGSVASFFPDVLGAGWTRGREERKRGAALSVRNDAAGASGLQVRRARTFN
jgi:hypothetical protein